MIGAGQREKGREMGTRSRYMDDFPIAGMRYWDAALALRDLGPGDNLSLVAEPDNPHDPDAVAICWEGSKLGYIPRESNALPAQLLAFGHGDVIECRILKVDPQAETCRQIHVGLYMTKKGCE